MLKAAKGTLADAKPKAKAKAKVVEFDKGTDDEVVYLLAVTVVQCSGLPKSDTFGENDVYVGLVANRQTRKTRTIHGGGTNPSWEDGEGGKLNWSLGGAPDHLDVTVWDDDGGDDDMIGQCQIPLKQHLAETGWTQKAWFHLKDIKGRSAGRVKLHLELSLSRPGVTPRAMARSLGGANAIQLQDNLKTSVSSGGDKDSGATALADDDSARGPVVDLSHRDEATAQATARMKLPPPLPLPLPLPGAVPDSPEGDDPEKEEEEEEEEGLQLQLAVMEEGSGTGLSLVLERESEMTGPRSERDAEGDGTGLGLCDSEDNNALALVVATTEKGVSDRATLLTMAGTMVPPESTLGPVGCRFSIINSLTAFCSHRNDIATAAVQSEHGLCETMTDLLWLDAPKNHANTLRLMIVLTMIDEIPPEKVSHLLVYQAPACHVLLI